MIKLLDCTLRDGGYNNNWEFGSDNIQKIFSGLVDSNMDIIECGFLTQKVDYNSNQSKYNTFQQIEDLLHTSSYNCLSVCMINYGEYEINDIPERKESFIDGVRIAFHKKNLDSAILFSEKIIEKGYKVFLQPMVSMSYSDEEFLKLIRLANQIKPYAFYIVDSFGVMKKQDLLRFYYLVDNNLDVSIKVGFHSHNNLQLSYSNAQTLVDIYSKREIIIDASIMGMGRGAGNLNTELFIEYLNDKLSTNYLSEPLLHIVDEILTPIYYHNFWGYSLPHYLSAIHGCHPNYATFLDDKNTLTVSDINNILSAIPSENKVNFQKDFAEGLYIEYQSSKNENDTSERKLKEKFKDKRVLLLAPGTSLKDEESTVKDFIKNNLDILVIAVNFIPNVFNYDYLFVSNLRRYEQIKNHSFKNLIVTSNISLTSNDGWTVNYSDLLNDNCSVADNSGLMLIKLLIKFEAKNIFLAGFDGYSQNIYMNYAQKKLAFIKKEDTMQAMNVGMSKVLKEFNKNIAIRFITKEKYVKI